MPRFSVSPETRSNPLEVAIEQPRGYEKEAARILIQADGLLANRNYEEASEKYSELAHRYPNSVYAPVSLRTAAIMYSSSTRLEERRKVIRLCETLIDNYPRHHYVQSCLALLCGTYRMLKDKEGVLRTLTELIQNHPNTQIAERGQYWLEKIEEWEF